MPPAARNVAYEIETLVGELTGRIGVRLPTSSAEARAAALVNGRLRRAGMGVSTYELRVTPYADTTYAFYAGLGLGGAALALGWPWPAAPLGVALLAVALVDAFVAPLPPLGPHRVSQNIVGVRAMAETAGAPLRWPRWRVLILAPLDTPLRRDGLARFSGPGRLAVLVRALAAMLLLIGATGAVMAPGPWQPVLIGSALLFGLTLLGALQPPTPDPADGGCAALAALVAAATRLQALEQVEVWAVAVGASGSDPGGVISLVRRYPFERDRTLMIALESLAGDQLVYATGEGVWRSRPADALLVRLAAAAQSADPQIDAHPHQLGRMSVLAAPLRRLGYRTLTLTARQTPRVPPPPPLDPTCLAERAARLVVGIVHQLDTESPP